MAVSGENSYFNPGIYSSFMMSFLTGNQRRKFNFFTPGWTGCVLTAILWSGLWRHVVIHKSIGAQRVSILCCDVIYQTRETVFHLISKHREESWKYNPQRSIFDKIRGIWKSDETLSQVFDIFSKSKQKLRSKRRNQIVKIQSKPPTRLLFPLFNVINY